MSARQHIPTCELLVRHGECTCPPDEPLDIDGIRRRSLAGSADWDDPISDARALLAEVDRLRAAQPPQ